MATVIDGDLTVRGSLVPTRVALPSGSVTDATVTAGAKIGAAKVVHRFAISATQVPGTAVVAETRDLFIARAAGTVVAVEAAITGAIATGTDRHVFVDLHKSTGAGAFASVLSADIDLDDGSTLRTAVAGTITSASYVAGDIFRLVVAVSGSDAAQAEGLIVTVHFDEEPN